MQAASSMAKFSTDRTIQAPVSEFASTLLLLWPRVWVADAHDTRMLDQSGFYESRVWAADAHDARPVGLVRAEGLRPEGLL